MSTLAPDLPERRAWPIVLTLWAVQRFRPLLGWIVFLATLLLALLPVVAVREAGWVNLTRAGITPEWVVGWGVLIPWLLLRGAAPITRWRRIGLGSLRFLLWLLFGLLVISHTIVHWIPSPVRLWQTAATRTWAELAAVIWRDWSTLGWRFAQWFVGISEGGATQDNIVFVTLLAIVLWLASGLSVWLALRKESGLLLALPSIWLLTLTLYYGDSARWLLITALAVTLLLHLWLDHSRLERAWQQAAVDYSPLLLYDRLGFALGAGVFVLILAAVVPSPSIPATVRWAYRQLQPLYKPLEETGERLFPELDRPWRGHAARRGQWSAQPLFAGSRTLSFADPGHVAEYGSQCGRIRGLYDRGTGPAPLYAACNLCRVQWPRLG